MRPCGLGCSIIIIVCEHPDGHRGGTIFKTCMMLGCAAVHTRACIGAIGVITELSPRRPVSVCGLQGGREFDWWCA